MRDRILSTEERDAINSSSWFASLSPSLRHDILCCAAVRRYHDGALVWARETPAQAWCAVARGAVRLSSSSADGRQSTLAYLEPGAWFGEMVMLEDGARAHDAHAGGETTLLMVPKAAFDELLARHVELYAALLRLSVQRMRMLFKMVEDATSLPQRARLAKTLHSLSRRYGVPLEPGSSEVRIGLPLPQAELARLIGGSRQRINLELKSMERESVIRLGRDGLVVQNGDALRRIAGSGLN